MRRFSALLIASYTMAMLAAAAFLLLKGDRSAVGMLLIFGPRWVLLVPWALLLPMALATSRRMVLLAGAGIAVTAFGVVLVEIPALPPRGAARLLRVVTYNTDLSRSLATSLESELATWDADIVLLQDCRGVTAEALMAIAKRDARSRADVHDRFCMITRLPLEAVEPFPDRPGRGQVPAVRYRLRVNGQPLTVVSVHLSSPRQELSAARHGDPSRLENSIRLRATQSALLSRWARGSGEDYIVAGDFNVPEGSGILRDDWSGLRNAFGERGWGIGNTMFAGFYGVRIDHVFTTPSLTPLAVRILKGYPTEHQPVVVDIGK